MFLFLRTRQTDLLVDHIYMWREILYIPLGVTIIGYYILQILYFKIVMSDNFKFSLVIAHKDQHLAIQLSRKYGS